MQSQSKFLKIVLFLGDAFLMALALFLALFLRNRGLVGQFNSFLYGFIILYVVWVFIIFVLGLYGLYFFKKKIDFLFNLIVFSVLAFFIGVTYFYFRPAISVTPKTILLLDIIIFDILFLVWRYSFDAILKSRGVKEKAIIVGFHEKIAEILPQIREIYNVVAVFCPPSIAGQKKCSVLSPDIEIVSEATDLKNIISEKKVTSIIFAIDFYSNKDLVKGIFTDLPLTINYVGIDELYEAITKKVSLDYLDEVWFLEKISKPESVFEQSVKRIFDIVLALIGLFVFIISFPFIAAAIKMNDGGPVFYEQKRVGKNGKNFVLYKFRTMREAHNQDVKVWREKDGENITKVGLILRKLHLDELPQAYNILIGDMSFVGPRAEWRELANVFEKEIPFYKQRYLVKPGLFGWAQINFPASKSVNEAKEKFEYDLYYIKNHSLRLDLEIILKAIRLFLL